MLSWKKLRILLSFLAPSLLFGSVIGAYPGYQIYHYTWYNAQFCTTCHVHDYASVGWKNSIHGQMNTCHDCHHQRLRDYIWEMIVMIKNQPKFPKDLHHTPFVKKELCAACHVSNAADRSTITGPLAFEDIQKIPKVDLSKAHAIHLGKTTDLELLNSHELDDHERGVEDLRPSKDLSRNHGQPRLITCADCHGGPANRGHNFSAVDSTCVRCHEAPHETKVGSQFGCRSCHFQEFLIPTKTVQ